MNHPHNGKIARLPHLLREQVHSRLRDGEPGNQIVAWLNSMPEVQAVLAAAFGGRPISPANLSQWRKQAHRDWLLQQAALGEASRFVADARELAQAGRGAVTDHLATFLTAEYAGAVLQLSSEADPAAHWKRLRALCHDVAALRRGDQYAESMRLHRHRLAMRLAGIPAPSLEAVTG
jgi:hypothetical protein